MLSLEECKEYLGDTSLSDEQIEELRDALYEWVEAIIEKNRSDN